MTPCPLAGRRVLVTRAASDSVRWARRLTALGARPVILPCLITEPLTDAATRDRFRGLLPLASWLVLTSRRGVEAASALWPDPLPTRVRLAAVGPGTARAIGEKWRTPDLVASESTGVGLARDLIPRLRAEQVDGPVLAAGAENGRDDVVRALTREGLEAVSVPVYRTIPSPSRRPLRDLVVEGIEDILLASPSAVVGLLNQARPPAGVRIITIGPTTTSAARAAGLAVAAEASHPTLEGMLEAVP